MLVPDEVRKSVVFIGFRKADGSMQLAGSGFFLGKEKEEGRADPVFLVTAKHVLDGIRRLGIDTVYIRANLNSGEAKWFECRGEWLFHPDQNSVDLAIYRCGIPSSFDHLAIGHSLWATAQELADNEVGPGDEVFVTGLFRHHSGNQRNIPIVRIGNLAAMSEEKVRSSQFGDMDAYLIEARSIGGLSGSAVFLNMGVIRYVHGTIKHSTNGPRLLLLGLIHGHYDVPDSALDDCAIDHSQGLTTARVNTGIAIVVPITKVMEAVDHHLQASWFHAPYGSIGTFHPQPDG